MAEKKHSNKIRHGVSEGCFKSLFIHLLREIYHCYINETGAKYEPPNDKTNNVAVRLAKTQISLGIRPV